MAAQNCGKVIYGMDTCKMRDVSSLLELSAVAVVGDRRLIEGRLQFLPRPVLQGLLIASVRQSRLLCLRTLLSCWPLGEILLRECQEFNDATAALFAYCLQSMRHGLKVLDIRGCKIGFHGTTAFCKLALDLPVSENDVCDMKVLDTRHLRQATRELPEETQSKRVPPLMVLLDCTINKDNYGLAKQAFITHTNVDLKVSHLTLSELERTKIESILSLLEPSVITGLDLQMNSVGAEGVSAISPVLTGFTNLIDLNLAYNRLTYRDTRAVAELGNACGNLHKLRKLNLTENDLRSETCSLLRYLKCPLKSLLLNGCGIREAELRAMAHMDILCQLESLELSTNALVHCIDSVPEFVIKSAKTLRHLSIEDNMLNCSCVAPLCQMLKKLDSLKTLSLCYNHFLPDDIQVFHQKFPALEIENRDWLY